MKTMTTVFLTCLCAAMVLAACSSSNNLLLGRVQSEVGGHNIVVTDCYRTKVPAPQQLADTAHQLPVFRFTPCRDADVLIQGGELIVNGVSYGRLNEADSVMVDHGQVLINDKAAVPAS